MTTHDRINAQVKTRLGIHIGDQKMAILKARLERLQAQEGYSDLEDFQKSLEAGDPRALDALARHVTTNHTFFYREPEHFSVMVDHLKDSKISRPRVWSAAGSSGEEGYSLAMVLAEAGIEDFRILVSDVNRDVLATAHRGVFSSSRMGKIPAVLVPKYFQHLSNGEYRVKSELRSHLRFRCLNLVHNLDFEEPPDVVFCRNVFIYFDLPGIQRVLERLVRTLKPGGLLFLGHAEGFHLPPGPIRRVGPAVYRKFPKG